MATQTISDSMIYKSYLKWCTGNTGDRRHMVNDILDDGLVTPDNIESEVPKEWAEWRDGWWREHVKISVSDKTWKRFTRVG